MPIGEYKDFADCVAKNQDKDNPEAYCGKIKHQVEDSKSEGQLELKDPRGDGAVLDDRGQPNIIDYSNQEPLLFGLGDNSSHEYPGKIVITNESRYVDREVKRSHIPNVAATGRDATGSDKTQPTLPTGAPYELQKPSHNMHGMNFNTPVDWSKQEVVSLPGGLVARQVGCTKDCKKEGGVGSGRLKSLAGKISAQAPIVASQLVNLATQIPLEGVDEEDRKEMVEALLRDEAKKVLREAQFLEEQHPRDEKGKFSSGEFHKNTEKVANAAKKETPENIQKDIFQANPEHRFFMDAEGDSVKGGDEEHSEIAEKYADQLDIEGITPGKRDAFDMTRDFMIKTGMIRMIPGIDKEDRTFQGDVGFEIHGNVSSSQLRRMRQYEKDGHKVHFDVWKGESTTDKELIAYGSSFKELAAGLRKAGFLSEAIMQDHMVEEGIENLFGPPASQAFADTGNNPHLTTDKENYKSVEGKSAEKIIVDEHQKLGKPFDEKSDTGDDKTRTGPGGLLPRDTYDGIHYTGEKDTKIHLATPYFDGKEPHDVSGTIPELQEDIKITIEDPKQDENIPTIELNIKQPELELEKIEEEPQLELKNYPGPKDPDTHTSTIKAGEENIEDTIPISNIWKEEHGLAEAPASSIDIIKKMFPQLFASGILTMSLTELLDILKNRNYEQMDLFRGKKIEEMQKINPVKFLKFKYNSGATECPICKPLNGMEFADDDTTRPILPSEKMGKGVFNTHPNCLCTYEEITKLIEEEKTPKSEPPQSRAAAASLRERHDITEEYLRPLQESLNIYKDRMPGEFDWINDEAIENMKDFTRENPDGRFILAVVSGESYTDHRIEGESLRRHWTKEELMQNIRTAKHKLTDINHMWQKKDPNSGLIFDANWNSKTEKGEMALWESDQDILNAIRNDIITAVSINTGKPRSIDKNCDTGECLSEPTGTILGEDNNTALAFIVTDPEGFKYNGQLIPAMPPGMKFTKLFIIE